ncbi:unnamed protein product [Linum trigynum]|uniref:Uncharacterized protein n=1 Tax=Linum trigynum TaxID=586398 RepID=A0AAV2CCN6_9ROSI
MVLPANVGPNMTLISPEGYGVESPAAAGRKFRYLNQDALWLCEMENWATKNSGIIGKIGLIWGLAAEKKGARRHWKDN